MRSRERSCGTRVSASALGLRVRASIVATLSQAQAQSLALACLHALVFMVPLAVGNWTWLPGLEAPFTYDQLNVAKVFTLRVLTLAAFVAWAWHVLMNGGPVRKTRADYLILAVLGWVALSSALSVHPATAVFGAPRRFEGLLSFVNYAVIYFLAVQLLDGIPRIRSLARTLLISGVLVSAYGVLQHLGVEPTDWGYLAFQPGRAFSTYGNPNLLGGILVILLPISLGLALSENTRLWRIFYQTGFMLTVLCWIVTFTRGAWVGGAVALVILCIAVWRQRVQVTKLDWLFGGATAALSAIVLIRGFALQQPALNVWQRATSIFEFTEGSALVRLHIWDAAWRATLDRPVFGFGPDTFRLIFPGYKSIEYTQVAGHHMIEDNAHNYILQLTSTIGIPGMLLLYGLFAGVAALSFRAAFSRSAPGDTGAPLILAAFWAAAAGYLTHLIFGRTTTGSTFLLWIAMAALMATSARAIIFKPPPWGRIAAVGISGLVAVALLWSGLSLWADHQHLRGRISDVYAVRLAHATAAAQFSPNNDDYRAQIGVVHAEEFRALLFEAEALRQAGKDPAPVLERAGHVFGNAEDAIIGTIKSIPLEYDNYLLLVDSYLLAGQSLSSDYYSEAVTWARKGIALSPYGLPLRLQYATALERSEQTGLAQQELRIVIGLDPRAVEPRIALGRLLMREADHRTALEQFQQARMLRPDYPGIQSLIDKASASLR